MTSRTKKFLLWFVRLGKIKARLVHFLFLCIVYIIFFVTLDFALSQITHTPFFVEWTNNLPFSFFFFVCAPFISWRFYDVAQMQLKDYQKLEKKGLTTDDLKRIAFVKRWEQIRRSGLNKYCFYDGGLIAGMILLFPVSFGMFLTIKASTRLFEEFGQMIAFIGKNIILSYIIGLVIYRFRWLYNERRFRRLTNPVS